MNTTEAAAASRMITGFWQAELSKPEWKDRPERSHIIGRVDKAAYHAALDLLPEGAITALIETGAEAEPTIVSMYGDQLYFLLLSEVGNVDERVAVSFRSMGIKPGAGVVHLAARFRDQHNDGPSGRLSVWSFALDGGTKLSVECRYHPERGPDTRESFAWALAAALGYDIPVAQSTEPLVG